MDFTSFDPNRAVEQELMAVAELLVATRAADNPGLPTMPHEARIDYLKSAGLGNNPTTFYVARDETGPIAFAFLQLPQDENREGALVLIEVHPDRRREGIGTEFLRVLLPRVRAAGRTNVLGPNVVVGGAGEKWALATGFAPVLPFVVQHLVVADVDPQLWDVPVPEGYSLRMWTSAAPDEIVASYARARRAIQDRPKGDATWTDPEWTPERVRKEEAAFAAKNAEYRIVVAVHEASGEVAGITELFVSAGRPDFAQQLDTAVLREHRGRGLGRAVKAAMMRNLLSERPALARVATQTATAAMAQVNHQIGYTDVMTMLDVEAPLAELERRLAVGRLLKTKD